jgi:hypothetical protein
MKSVPSSLHGLAVKAKDGADLRKIDFVGRAAFGSLCVAAMAALAAPLLFGTGVVRLMIELAVGDSSSAIAWWLGAWSAALAAGGLFLLLFYTAWPLASDWIIEWPGYVVGFAIAGACLVILSLMVFPLSVPWFLAVPLSALAAFGLGFLLAGTLAGLNAPGARPRSRARAQRRR